MSLKTLAADALYALHLRGDYFAEVVTYIPRHGGERQVYATITARNALELGVMVEEETEYFDVLLGRDESHAKGGVNKPEIGDRIVRAGEHLADALGFAGEGVETHDGFHRLVFCRKRTATIGKLRQG